MSVSGEFQRYLRECLAHLENAAAGGGTAWEAALREAAHQAAQDLSAGAEHILSQRERLEANPPTFHTAPDSEHFRSLVDRLAQLCGVILGR